MAVKALLDTLDGVDDALHSLYTQKDGKYVLNVEGIDHHPDVANLKSAYERTKADRDAARQERDAAKARADTVPQDFSPEAWEAAKSGKPDDSKLIQLRTQLEAERDQWRTKFENAEQASLRNALDRDLSDALNAVGVNNPAYMRAARLLLADGVKMVDGKPVVDTDMGPLSLADHVKRWAAGDEGKAFVTPASGGGAKGADAGGSKPLAEMGDAERLELARKGQLKAATG